jgi:hypothetical protein
MIETLFFKCYYAYLLGNLPQTKFFYNVLQDEFKTKGSKNSLESYQFMELKRIRDSISSGDVSKRSWISELAGSVKGNPEPESMRQKDLVRKINDKKSVIQDLLNDVLYLYNIEQPCPPYGFVDMVFMGKETVYPVEVKKGQGRHDLIGQIAKYELHHRLMLHYHLYKYVQPVTVCSSYEPHALDELKQSGVIPLVYSADKTELTIKKL